MLLLTIINEYTNNEIDIKVPILWDDTVQQAKEKLYCYITSPGQIWHPRFIRLKIGEQVITKDSFTLSQYIDFTQNMSLNVELKIKNIIDEIQNDVIDGQIFEMNEDKLNNLYDKYKSEWVDISSDDIEFCTRFIIFKSNPVVYSNLRSKIEEYLNNILSEKQKLITGYNEEFDKMGQYYMFIKDSKLKPVDDTRYIYSLSLLLKRKVIDNIPSRFINVTQLFNDVQLDETIPFIALSGSFLKRKQPAIRVYNQIFEIGVSEKEFKNWFVNEKVKLGQISYKKIKGVLFKYKLEYGTYLTINLMETGDMIVSFNTNKQMDMASEYNTLNSIITDHIEKFIELLDTTYAQIYRKGSLIGLLSNYDKSVTNVTATGEIQKVMKTKLSSFLKNRYISDNLFDPKDTLNKEILSMFYKKYGKTVLDEDDDGVERKGITTTVQNHPENLEKSLVMVNLANSYEQVIIILLHIQFLGKFVEFLNGTLKETDEDEFVFEEEIEEEHKLRMKSNIKQLKEQGVKVLSTNCQKQRQPVISESLQPIDDSYELIFGNSRYICDKKDYPYPGFTNENIVCCFKKDQRRKEPYIRNMASQQLEESVQPSNFMIEVNHNGVLYKTFVIKSLSDLKKHKYHFLNQKLELIPIESEELIKALDEKEDIFLEPVSINVVITTPPKNKCNYIPDVSKRIPEDIHAQCRDIHEDKKYFGYNLNGYPCCFDKPRKEIVTRKKKEIDILKQHIITTDKILESNRLGTLPNGLNQLFNNISKENVNEYFYRMGVIQNNSSLLNVLLLALDNKIQNSNITGSIEFRKLLANFVKDSNTFKSLNQGDLSLTFTKDQFIMYLNQNTLRPSLILDLLTKITNVNIMILDYTNEHIMQLLCSKYITFKQDEDYIIVIKKGANYELVVKLEEIDESRKLTKLFSKNNKIIDILQSYYNESCVINYEYPENYIYKKPLSHKLIMKIFEKSEDHKIVSQIVNEFNKTHLLVTNSGFIVPVMETGIIPELKIISLFLPDFNTQIKGIELLNKTLTSVNKQFNKNIDILDVQGQIIQNEMLVALMTNYGIVIPVKPSSKVKNLEIVDYNYYSDVDFYLSNDLTVNDERMLYINRQKVIDYFVYKAKLIVSNYILLDSTKSILELIVKDVGVSMETKFEKIKDIVSKILYENIIIIQEEKKYEELQLNDTVEKLQIRYDLYEFIVDVITHDILIMENDSEILNNFVSKPEFLHEKREDNIDTLISNINDLDVFIKARKMEE